MRQWTAVTEAYREFLGVIIPFSFKKNTFSTNK